MRGIAGTYLRPLILGLGIGIGACGGGGGDTTPTTTAIAKASGDQQVGVVGQLLPDPLTVKVTDGGAATAGATVTWSTASGGSLEPASTATDANGNATSVWTLGTIAGSQTARATLSGATGSPVTFSASATPDGALALSKAGGDNQTGEVGTPLAAAIQTQAADEFGNGVAGVSIAWAATGATVSAPAVATDASGISAVNVTLGNTAGPITITATAAGLTGSPLTFNATAVVASPVPTTAAVSVGDIFFASAHNGSSNPAVDTVAINGTVTWTWAPAEALQHSVESTGSPNFTSSAVQVGPGKTYQFTFTAPGTYQYDCAVHGTRMTGRIVVR